MQLPTPPLPNRITVKNGRDSPLIFEGYVFVTPCDHNPKENEFDTDREDQRRARVVWEARAIGLCVSSGRGTGLAGEV